MASRRDLYQSYQFMMQRVVSSLVLRETDPAQRPLRRMASVSFVGVMLTVIAVAVAGIVGLVSPGGNNSWRTGGQVIIEEETGTRYVWVADASQDGGGRLHPVTNFASAALLAGSTTTLSVSRSSLAGAPRGQRIGLADAPDSLPSADNLTTAPWTLCSLPAVTASNESVPNTALAVGQTRTSGQTLGKKAILVRDTETSTLHLVWNGRQYPITNETAVLEGLTLRLQPQLDVGSAWLSGLPAGADLGPVTVDGPGTPSTVLGGATVGQLRYVESGSARQYYIVTKSSLRPLTNVQAQITLADPQTSKLAYGGNPATASVIQAADAAAANPEPAPEPDPTDAPSTSPPMADVGTKDSTVCASYADNGSTPDIAVAATVEGADLTPATSSRTENGTVLADRVRVRGGSGALVESMLSPTAKTGNLFLVTDDGKRYAIADGDALKSLGYAGVTPVKMPASLVARIPSGDVLDARSARAPA